MGQNELHRPHLFQGVEGHLRGTVVPEGKADIPPGVGEDNQPQLAAAVQDAQVAGVVEVDALVDGVELNPLHAQLRDAGQLGLPVREVGMHAAKGPQAGLRGGLVHLGRRVVDVDHLPGAGGHR